ncbi:MAG: YceD family protein [Nitritalea sp.]
MRYEANFEIDIIRLKEGEHGFTFTLDDAFIAHHGLEDWVEHMNIHVALKLLKSSTLLEARFTLNGVVTLLCDRSLIPFEESYSTTARMHYKYGPEERELDDEVYLIMKDTPKLSFVDLLKEYFLLGLPAKKIHPDYRDEMDDEDFEGEGKMVYYTDTYEEEADEELETDTDAAADTDEENTDPRWEILKKLKKKD